MMEPAHSQKGFISAFILKIIAAAAMLTDHLAVVFFNSQYMMRSVGRLAFPIFAFFVAEGYMRTHNIKKYAVRLIVFALIAQAPYALAFGGKVYEPNVIFTLFLGLCAVWAYDKSEGALKWIIPLTASFLAELSGSDHGAFGVFMVVLFFAAKTPRAKILSVGVLILAMTAFYAIETGGFGRYVIIMLFYLVPLALLYFYSGEKGVGGQFAKWFFYIFYPLHLLIIWVISIIF